MTDGLSYYELGRQTGAMAKKILVDKVAVQDIPVEISKNTKKVVNKNTLNKFKIFRKFRSFFWSF
mgnify:CR=1 FL=1